MKSIGERLAGVRVGDIVHGRYEGSAICLVTAVSPTAIYARTVTTQYDLVFDRETGTAPWGSDSIVTLDSIAPLPPHIHKAMLELDEKYRLRNAPEGGRLLPHQRDALLFLSDFHPAHPL